MSNVKNSSTLNAIKLLQTKREVDKGGGRKFQNRIGSGQSETENGSMHIKKHITNTHIVKYWNTIEMFTSSNNVQKEEYEIKTDVDNQIKQSTVNLKSDRICAACNISKSKCVEQSVVISMQSSSPGSRSSHGMMMMLKMAFLVAMFCTMVTAAAAKQRYFSSNRNGLWIDHQQKCPMAFHEIGGRCYFYGYFPLNWFRAAEFCHSFGQGVSLATIETAQENYHVKQWLMVNGDHNTGVWVGGSDNGHEGRWAWFPTGQLVDYSNWGPSQPSGDDQHCMYMVGGILGYQWADFHCEFNMNFLCEHGVNDAQPW